MNIDFYKIHVLKNDFILVDFRDYSADRKLMSGMAVSMCSRKTGIGANGIIFITSSAGSIITLYTFAPDGHIYDFTCDSSLCASRYIFDQIPVSSKSINLMNNDKKISVQLLDSINFRISAGNPLYDESSVDNIILDSSTYFYTSIQISMKGIVFFPEHRGNRELKELSRKIIKSGTFHDTVPLFIYPLSRNSIAAKTWYLSKQPDHCLYSALSSAASSLNGYENELIIDFNNTPCFCEWNRSLNEVFVTAGPEYSFNGSYFFDTSSAYRTGSE